MATLKTESQSCKIISIHTLSGVNAGREKPFVQSTSGSEKLLKLLSDFASRTTTKLEIFAKRNKDGDKRDLFLRN